MSAIRVMGIETEYGISVPSNPAANSMVASSAIVNSYAAHRASRHRARWDFEEENPLRDARGFELSRTVADASQLTDEEAGLANLILTNGARLYVDHAHPEYSSPEVLSPLDAVVWDKAGEQVMAAAAGWASAIPGGSTIQLYKNNVDNKGASYGCHENYLMDRSVQFGDIARHLIPFFVSRQVICGAGRVGIGQDGAGDGFQIAQRADYIEVEVGLETTLKRPIVNTRDEPHATPDRYRRLHVIVGDANLSEISTYLKLGTTSIVLSMIEAGFLADDMSISHPVTALHEVSHDPTLQYLIELDDGRKLTAVELQMEYAQLARKFLADKYGADIDSVTADVMTRWEEVLNTLATDPMQLSDQLDWVAKFALLESYRQRDNLSWSHPKLHLVDLQYSDIRPHRGLYQKLVDKKRMRRLTTDSAVQRAVEHPPEDTRAYFRGRCLGKYANAVSAASWDSVIFDIPGSAALQRVPTMEPTRGTKVHVGELLDRCETAAELLEALGSH